MKGVTPVQRRIITLVGAKNLWMKGFLDDPVTTLPWIIEALELLLLREVELAASEDGVELSEEFLDETIKAGVVEMEKAKPKSYQKRKT